MSRGLLYSAQSLLAGVIALARTRLELFGTELQEELTRLFFTLIGAMTVLLLGALGLAFAAFGALLALGEQALAKTRSLGRAGRQMISDPGGSP
jgi:uncharacterized membrane protein YqjE